MQASKDVVTEGAKLIKKNISMTKMEIVEWQLIIYCFVNTIQVNHTELKLLALLGFETGRSREGKIRVTEFCKMAVKGRILSSPQAVNTALYKLQRTNLLIKEGIGKKMIFLNPDLGILNKGNILIESLVFSIESNKTERTVQKTKSQAQLAGAVH